MSITSNPQRSRLLGWLLVIVLTAVIVGFVLLGLANATSRSFAAGPGGQPAGVVTSSATTGTATQTSTPAATAKPTAVPVAPATTQPTKSASITKPQTIVKAFTAKVTKMTAVQGVANGPGEIAGPAVRFTITLTNTTGEPIDLSTTVVNAYYGSDRTPADSLDGPGGSAFTKTLADGGTATGSYVFSIPEDERGTVEITIDTSVANSVVAFTGSAPR